VRVDGSDLFGQLRDLDHLDPGGRQIFGAAAVHEQRWFPQSEHDAVDPGVDDELAAAPRT
jgi:hypothetical protein